MDAQQGTRKVQKQQKECTVATTKGSRQICIPMSRQEYDDVWHDAGKVRCLIDRLAEEHAEMFPALVGQAYQLHGMLPESKKMPGI